MKIIQKIPLQNIESIPKLIKDFLNNDQGIFGEDLWSVENVLHKIEEKKTFKHRQTLHKVLLEQSKNLELTDLQQKNLQLLLEPNTYTVTTGHQLNLFSGPVFFIYKILQTIKTANWLNQKIGDTHVVPIFWMATEDHDFLEINHFNNEDRTYSTTTDSGGAVGRIFPDNLDFISKFQKDFIDYPFGKELIDLLKSSYMADKTLAQSTRILVQELFAKYGILIIDGDHSELKELMIPVFQDELLHKNLKNSTQKTVENLINLYGKVQVNPRDINLFYLNDKRQRIDPAEDGFMLADDEITLSEGDLLMELNQHPEKFSPNALMRPVYQETILPNIAYIGGNAEIMYWLELKEYFDYLNLPFPILIPRNSVLFLKEKTVKKIQKLQLNLNDFFEDFSAKINELVLGESGINPILQEKKLEINAIFTEIQKIASGTDITFKNMVDAEEKRMLNSFNRLSKRLLKAEKIKNKEKLEYLKNLYLAVHPKNSWQERVYNFSFFYKDFGNHWLNTCYDEMEIEQSVLLTFVY